MSIDKRIMNQVMLRGCKFRITADDRRDEVSVPIPISFRIVSPWHEWDEKGIGQATEIASQRFTISKNAAQAYLDLYAKVTDMTTDLTTISNLSRQFRTAKIHEICEILGRIEGLAWGLNDRMRCFLEDEMVAGRKDYAV